MVSDLFQRITSIRDTIIGISFIILTAIIIGVVLCVYFDILTVDLGALIVSSLLAIATFGYVALTYMMANTMREEMRHSEEVFKLRRKDDIISIIEGEIRPVIEDIQRHESEFNADQIHQYDSYSNEDSTFERIPKIKTNFDMPMDAVQFSNEVDINAGEVYEYFYKIEQYQEKHQRAVTELESLILNNHEDIGIDPNRARDYAKAALAIEPVGGISRNLWNDNKDNIIPLRSDVSEITGELYELKQEIRKMGRSIIRDLGQAEARLRQEYYITESDV